MADDDAKRASRKELARQQRKDAYRAMKERRAKDPRYLAMKEAVKLQRREMYQRIKAQRKTTVRADKTKQQAEKAEVRAAMDSELMKMVKVAVAKGPYDVN